MSKKLWDAYNPPKQTKHSQQTRSQRHPDEITKRIQHWLIEEGRTELAEHDMLPEVVRKVIDEYWHPTTGDS